MVKLQAFVVGLLSAETIAVADWPTDASGARLPCPSVTVLADTATGWPGSCLGLERQNNLTTWTTESCKDACSANPLCSVWQLTDESKCWLGVPGHEGTECYGRDGDTEFTPTGSQRLQQGTVKVLKNYTAEWVDGLANLGVMSSLNGVEDKDRCQNQCYSDVSCRYWMYGTGGCWLERAPDNIIPDDPVTSTSSDLAKELVGGEHIEHQCLPPPPPEESNLPMILGLIIGLLLALCLLGIIYTLCCKKEKKAKKTRAVKVAAKKEEPKPAVTYSLLEPTYTTYVTPAPMYQMVPQAPPVEIVQPVTYAAPVTSSVVMPAATYAAPVGSVQMAPAAPTVVMGGSVQMAPAMAMEAPMVIR